MEGEELEKRAGAGCAEPASAAAPAYGKFSVSRHQEVFVNFDLHFSNDFKRGGEDKWKEKEKEMLWAAEEVENYSIWPE